MSLLTGLISAWELNEASGNALDSHGSNTLTDNNTVGSGTGLVYGTARDFEATDGEYLSRASNASLQTGDIDFSLGACVKFGSKGATRVVLGKWPATGSFEYLLYYDSGADRFSFAVSSTGSGNPGEFAAVAANNLGAPSVGVWYHLVAWHDATANQIGIAVNAGTPNTTAHSGGVRAGTAPLNVGRNDDGDTNFWDGLIGPVRIWKRVLTSQERTDLYNGGAGLAYSAFGGGGSIIPRVMHHRRMMGRG